MIPKKIHYCWFGKGKKSPLILKCIASWKKYMPEYDIIEWNEDNFLCDNVYFKQALELKKYAFASDYARLKIIYDCGGIYFDTDVELIKSIKHLLNNNGFIGFEKKTTVNTGLGFASKAKSKVTSKMLAMYDNIMFVNNNVIDNTPCPVRNTMALTELGLKTNNTIQIIEDVTVYPTDYFCPMNYDSGKLFITPNTHSIHHYNYSWSDSNSKKVLKLKRIIFHWCPSFCAQFIFNILNHLLIRRK